MHFRTTAGGGRGGRPGATQHQGGSARSRCCARGGGGADRSERAPNSGRATSRPGTTAGCGGDPAGPASPGGRDRSPGQRQGRHRHRRRRTGTGQLSALLGDGHRSLHPGAAKPATRPVGRIPAGRPSFPAMTWRGRALSRIRDSRPAPLRPDRIPHGLVAAEAFATPRGAGTGLPASSTSVVRRPACRPLPQGRAWAD